MRPSRKSARIPTPPFGCGPGSSDGQLDGLARDVQKFVRPYAVKAGPERERWGRVAASVTDARLRLNDHGLELLRCVLQPHGLVAALKHEVARLQELIAAIETDGAPA